MAKLYMSREQILCGYKPSNAKTPTKMSKD